MLSRLANHVEGNDNDKARAGDGRRAEWPPPPRLPAAHLHVDPVDTRLQRGTSATNAGADLRGIPVDRPIGACAVQIAQQPRQVLGVVSVKQHGAHVARGGDIPGVDADAVDRGNAVEPLELRAPVVLQTLAQRVEARVLRRGRRSRASSAASCSCARRFSALSQMTAAIPRAARAARATATRRANRPGPVGSAAKSMCRWASGFIRTRA